MQVECKVNFIRFRSPDNGYTVFETKMEGRTEFVSCRIPGVRVGSTLLLDGEFDEKSGKGRTFRATKGKEIFRTEQSVQLLLSSGLIKGIGPGLAKRIVDRFGTDTLNIMDNSPDRLCEVPGITGRNLPTIKEAWTRHRESGEMLVELQDMGLEGSLALRILAKYGAQTKTVIDGNPYCLTDIWNVPFALADAIALGRGIKRTDPRRIAGGIRHQLEKATEEGHTYLPFGDLKESVAQSMGVPGDLVRENLVTLIKQGLAVNEGDAIYLPSYLNAEKGVAENLKRLSCDPPVLDGSPEDLDELLGLRLDESQRQAVRNMVTSPVSILTGGPGTGKTTIIRGMLKVLEDNNQRVALAAPTGRAAKRMSELTGHIAKTIHRLLKYRVGKGFQANRHARLTFDAVIIDECSMMDVRLMDSLLSALEPGTRVVLVGDIDQLPSVGAGDVLRDLIDCGVFPVTRLEMIHRQAASSRIVTNAYAVNHNLPLKPNGGDFFFRETPDPDIPSTVLSLVGERIPKVSGIDTRDIQVLCATRRMTEDVNGLLQEKLNDGQRINAHLKVGDKVMQQVNDYEKHVFNGDIGTILSFDSDTGSVTVDFDGRDVEYGPADFDEIEPAYAVTVHKSQGSEYKAVIVCLSPSDRGMLQRNLLYTAITRARELLVVIGSWNAVETCAANERWTSRNSRLKGRITDGFGEELIAG